MVEPHGANPNVSKVIVEMTLTEAERKRASDRVNQRYSRAKRKSRLEELEKDNRQLLSRLSETEGRLRQLQQDFDNLKAAVDIAHSLSHSAEVLANKSPHKISDRQDRGSVAREAAHASPSTLPVLAASPPTNAADSYILANGHLNSGLLLDLPIDFGTGLVVNLSNDYIRGRARPEYSLSETAHISLPWPNSGPFVQDPTSAWTGNQHAAAHAALEMNQPFSESPPSILSVGNPQSLPLWRSLPRHVTPPTTHIDHVLVNVSELGRQWRRQRGDKYEELSQDGFPSISSLLNPTVGDAALNPISTAIGKHSTWGTCVISLPSRVAYHYIVAHMVRWLVCQSEETFNQLPHYLRPTELQRTVPHPAWVDVFPWTEGRDLIVQHMDFGQFETFQRLTSDVSINWPYADADMFLTDPTRNYVALNPVFKTHIRDIRNWTFNPTVAEAFPFLAFLPTEVEK